MEDFYQLNERQHEKVFQLMEMIGNNNIELAQAVLTVNNWNLEVQSWGMFRLLFRAFWMMGRRPLHKLYGRKVIRVRRMPGRHSTRRLILRRRSKISTLCFQRWSYPSKSPISWQPEETHQPKTSQFAFSNTLTNWPKTTPNLATPWINLNDRSKTTESSSSTSTMSTNRA